MSELQLEIDVLRRQIVERVGIDYQQACEPGKPFAAGHDAGQGRI